MHTRQRVYQSVINWGVLRELMARTAAAHQPAWVKLVRDHLRRAFVDERGKPQTGWFVGGYRTGGAYLQHRTKGGAEVVPLPYQWREADAADLMQRLSVIAKAMDKGNLSLTAAAAKAEGLSSRTQEDWRAALAGYRERKLGIGRKPCSPKNFEVMHMRYLNRALALLEGPKAPRDGASLLEALAMSNARWKPGSQSRIQAVSYTAAFLRFCVERAGYAERWRPPSDLVEITGSRIRSAEPVGLDDREILALLETIKEPDLRFLLQVLAVFGCRPEDARQLELRNGHFFSGYRKASGGGSTEPRYLRALLLRNSEGQQVQWNLEAKWKVGERFPQFPPGNWGTLLNQRLRYHKPWQQLVQIYADDGKALKVSYAFRHGYVRRGQLLQIPPKVLADACGHSLTTHLKVYSAWDSQRDAERWFDAPSLQPEKMAVGEG